MRSLLFLPNLLSCTRILLALLFFQAFHESDLVWATVFFTLAVSTDMIDGYIARTYNASSSWGAFLDPFADKILVFSALGSFYWKGLLSGWILSFLALRDFFITGARCFLLTDGKALEASYIAKSKTVMQFFLIYLLLGSCWLSANVPAFCWHESYELLVTIVLYFVLLLALYSGLLYGAFLKKRFFCTGKTL